MKLYTSNTSPYGRKVRIVLAEKGLTYEQDTTGAQVKSVAELARLNPGLQVPILVDDGRTLYDSDLVIEYLLKTYPALPEGAAQPPLADGLTRPERHWADAKILSTLATLLESTVNLRQLFLSGIAPEQSDYLRRHQTRIQYCLDWLDGQATPQGFFPGSFSVQDIALICALEFGEWREIFPWRGRANLEGVMTRFHDRPSVAATRPAE
jgi:glutathione S-transferase